MLFCREFNTSYSDGSPGSVWDCINSIANIRELMQSCVDPLIYRKHFCFFFSDNYPLLHMRPIGLMESCFKYKNGTPRQPGLVSAARGKLTISRNLYSSPEHSLEGLEEFSHVWWDNVAQNTEYRMFLLWWGHIYMWEYDYYSILVK